MCGIIGANAQRDVMDILLEGLKRLEYRGYDSAGVAIIDQHTQQIQRQRVLGKVIKLEEALQQEPLLGHLGIAHTRWATHGQPTTANAHPHCSNEEIAVVHNGIIENHEQLRAQLIEAGYQFDSQTDTEVIVHLIHFHFQQSKSLLDAIAQAKKTLKGAFALGIISRLKPDYLYAVRCGSPLVIGCGIGENFIASDPLALAPVTQRFIYLEEGDVARIANHEIEIFDEKGELVQREVQSTQLTANSVSRGKYRHFMQKEIFEQPEAIAQTVERHLLHDHLSLHSFGHQAPEIFSQIKRIQIIACGTSYHAGLLGQYWLEHIARIPTRVEVASEHRYRRNVVEPDTLLLAISQSGETADTLAALRQAKPDGYYATLAVCNVAQSTLAREADLVFLTHAGTEIGVAATKTFTTQSVALLLLALILADQKQQNKALVDELIEAVKNLPSTIKQALKLDDEIKKLSKRFTDKQQALFLGRDLHYPIALEGALKLKEISYLHAQAYPAGELKHGPLALVDEQMPVIINAPNDHLIEKLQSNIQEVQARGGELYVFADQATVPTMQNGSMSIIMPDIHPMLSPIVYTVPLQLLAYHIALQKGTDVDQPRNLAKSVTVE